MDLLTAPEIEAILQRLEAVVTALEHDLSARTFYTFVLTAQALTETKHRLSTLAHIRRCLTLAHRMRAIRDKLFASGRWTPLTNVLEVIHSDATRLTTLYGVARPPYRTHRRALQQALQALHSAQEAETHAPAHARRCGTTQARDTGENGARLSRHRPAQSGENECGRVAAPDLDLRV